MKYYTEEQILDEFIGKEGTARRDAFEANLQRELRNRENGAMPPVPPAKINPSCAGNASGRVGRR